MIVPAYNASAHIRDAIRSALDQTHDSLEVLVVDDGSTDDTAAVVERIARGDGRVRLIRQANAGVAAARNAGIAAARGLYVAPLDADDLWYPEKLAAQVDRMEQGGPGMGMVYSWWVSVDETATIRGSSFPCRAEGNVALSLLYVNFIGNASVPLFRRDAVEQVGGYDASLRARDAQGCEDWDLSLRVAARYDTGVAPGHHVGYRQRPGSMSMNVAEMARSYDAVVDRLKREWSGVPASAYRWSEGNFASYLASQSYAGGRYAEALRWATHGLRVDPAYALAPYTHRLIARSAARMVGGEPLARLIRQRRGPRPEFTLSEVDAEWMSSQWPMPWARSAKPFDRVRTRRWNRLADAPPPILTTDSSSHAAQAHG